MTLAALDNGLLLLLGILCLVILSVAMLRRSQHKVATGRDLTRESLARLRDQREVRQSMDDLLEQLEELSRRIDAQVETRSNKLEGVLRDADQRIGELAGLVAQATGMPAPASASPAQPANRVEKDEFQPGLPREAPQSKRHTPPPAAPTAPTTGLPRTRAERFQRIYDLADKGTPPMAIADALQIPLGEVELILNLRRLT